MFLGLEGTKDLGLLSDLIDSVQATLEAACNRDERPFQDAIAAREEVKDGTGTSELYLDYVPSAIASIVLGTDPDHPDETIDPGDKTKVVWGDSCRLARVDGHRFGHLGQPRYVHVTYDAEADLPARAKTAIMRVVAAVYRQRGSEDATRERIGGYETDIAQVAKDDPIWSMAVQQLWEGRL